MDTKKGNRWLNLGIAVMVGMDAGILLGLVAAMLSSSR